MEQVKKKRGSAGMNPETRRRVASAGGKTVSRDKEHMAAIGRLGGAAVSKNREHMAEIGRKGGSNGRGRTRQVGGSSGSAERGSG